MADDKKLSDMLDNLAQNNQEQAQASFHDYLKVKIQEIIVKKPDVEQENSKE